MKTILHPEFATRMQQACDGNPKIPPPNYGRLGWFAKQFEERFEREITQETVRKWFAGESRPRHDMLLLLSQILQVDPAWLGMGKDDTVPEKKIRQQNSAATGVVNLVAGMIQICGGTPAFPTKEGVVDLNAVIKGALYQLHIILGLPKVENVIFNINVDAADTLVIGVVRTSELSFSFYELEWDKITEIGHRQGSHWVIDCGPDEMQTWKMITTFADRL